MFTRCLCRPCRSSEYICVWERWTMRISEDIVGFTKWPCALFSIFNLSRQTNVRWLKSENTAPNYWGTTSEIIRHKRRNVKALFVFPRRYLRNVFRSYHSGRVWLTHVSLLQEHVSSSVSWSLPPIENVPRSRNNCQVRVRTSPVLSDKDIFLHSCSGQDDLSLWWSLNFSIY